MAVEAVDWGARSGEGCVAIRGAAGESGGFSQTITVQESSRYLASCWLKSDSPKVSATLRVRWLDPQGTTLKTDEKAWTPSSPHIYENLVMEAYSPPGAASARIGLEAFFTGDATLLIDDFYMVRLHVLEGGPWVGGDVMDGVAMEPNILGSRRLEDYSGEYGRVVVIGHRGEVLADVGEGRPRIIYDPSLMDVAEAERRARILLEEGDGSRELEVESWIDRGVMVGDLAQVSIPGIGVAQLLHVLEAEYDFRRDRMRLRLGGRRRLLEDVVRGISSSLESMSIAFRQGEAVQEVMREPRVIYVREVPPITMENPSGVVLDGRGRVVLAEGVVQGSFESSATPEPKAFKRWIRCGFKGEGDITAEILRADGTRAETLQSSWHSFLQDYIPRARGEWITEKSLWQADNGSLETTRGIYNPEAVKLVRLNPSQPSTLKLGGNLSINISDMRYMRFAALTDTGNPVRVRLMTDEGNYLEASAETGRWTWTWNEIGMGVFMRRGDPDLGNINSIEFLVEDGETGVLAVDYHHLFMKYGAETLRLKLTLRRPTPSSPTPAVEMIYWVWEVA